jgi:hypothetical protein
VGSGAELIYVESDQRSRRRAFPTLRSAQYLRSLSGPKVTQSVAALSVTESRPGFVYSVLIRPCARFAKHNSFPHSALLGTIRTCFRAHQEFLGRKHCVVTTEAARSKHRGTQRNDMRGVSNCAPLNLQNSYERWRASAARLLEASLAAGRRGGKWSAAIGGRCSTVPITGASSIPSA